VVVAAFRGTLSRSFTSSLNRESPNTVPDTPPPWSSSFVCAVYPDLGMPGNFIPTGKVLNFPGLETGYNELPGLDMPRRTAHGLEYAILNYSPIPARSLCIGNASERTNEPAPLRQGLGAVRTVSPSQTWPARLKPSNGLVRSHGKPNRESCWDSASKLS